MLVRLYIKSGLEKVGQVLRFEEKQSHYLANVLRMRIGDVLYVFDGNSGGKNTDGNSKLRL